MRVITPNCITKSPFFLLQPMTCNLHSLSNKGCTHTNHPNPLSPLTPSISSPSMKQVRREILRTPLGVKELYFDHMVSKSTVAKYFEDHFVRRASRWSKTSRDCRSIELSSCAPFSWSWFEEPRDDNGIANTMSKYNNRNYKRTDAFKSWKFWL